MHLLLIVIAGVIIAHWIMYSRASGGCGCLTVLILLLLIGSCAAHH